MASATRSVAKVVEYYRVGIGQYISLGLGPPPDFVTGGRVSIAEAMPVLLYLHGQVVSNRVARDTTRVIPKAVRKVGEAVVTESMLTELARIYGVRVSDFGEAMAMYQRGTKILEPNQPMAEGDYDLDLLRAEAEEVLSSHAGTAVDATALTFATVGDPRLDRRLSVVAAVRGGLAWASMFRPHEIEELRYADLQSIWLSSGQWRFDFIDWRCRAFYVKERAEWDLLMDSVRRESAKAGFVWKVHYEGKRE